MTGIRKTGLVVLGATAALLGWETWTLLNAHGADTISEAIWNATQATPLVPLVFGLLMGHWFFPKSVCVHCGRRPWAKDRE